MVAFNFEHVADILRAMDVPDADEIVAGVRGGSLKEAIASGWSDGTLACWLKNNRTLRANGPRPQGTDDVVTAVLHVFPISYSETPEGLARIREDRTKIKSSVCSGNGWLFATSARCRRSLFATKPESQNRA